MNLLIGRNIIVSSTLLTLVACAAAPTEEEEGVATEQAAQPLKTGASSSGSTGNPGTIDPVGKTCLSKCLETRISHGWCGAFCECRAFGSSVAVCERKASERFIDI